MQQMSKRDEADLNSWSVIVEVDEVDLGYFAEPWAARHNQEIWGTGPRGIRDDARPTSGSREVGTLKQP
jgi:hypothetical protein